MLPLKDLFAISDKGLLLHETKWRQKQAFFGISRWRAFSRHGFSRYSDRGQARSDQQRNL
ncbi:hypothetical protein AGR4A_Cc190163 [Agrobacterium tumefaciens str. B6]|uniref:Uncharacterized protein n=2 Tax=Agrobacterium tumefaciens TaxID=358 RepID=A0A822UY96_AGRTU|nr:hypothetical protein AGR4C_Cc120005 [Agrobacterium tumefaciens str. Kerr 14]CVI15490.1 hypothetical protein AGR4A_Cc190163 [Agrobacterium tumefaciens str. B6]